MLWSLSLSVTPGIGSLDPTWITGFWSWMRTITLGSGERLMQSNRFICTGPSVEINTLRVLGEYLVLDSYSRMHSGFQILWLWAYTSVTDSKLRSCWHDGLREWVTSCAPVAMLCVGPQLLSTTSREAYLLLSLSCTKAFEGFSLPLGVCFCFPTLSGPTLLCALPFFFKQSLKGPPYVISLPFLLHLARQTGPSGLARGSFRSLPGHLTTLASQANDLLMIPAAFPWWHMPHWL